MNNTTNMKSEQLYAAATRENGEKRAALAPEIIETWRNFSKTVFKEGALPEKTKQLIAVAVAMRKGASKEEIMEAVWVAAEMRAGAAYAHSALAMDEMEAVEKI